MSFPSKNESGNTLVIGLKAEGMWGEGLALLKSNVGKTCKMSLIQAKNMSIFGGI